MPLLLELFSGTKSIGKAFEALGWEVFSVDSNPKTEPSLAIDVQNLTPEMIPGRPDFVWASPPCTHYSIARTYAKLPQDLEGSDALVRKTLDLIRSFHGVFFMIENPHSGLLKTRDVIQSIPMLVLDYCKYGAEYRKRTSIWTNTQWLPSQPLCKHDCPASDGKCHPQRAQQVPHNPVARRRTVNQLYMVPPKLCDEIARYINNTLIVVLD